MMDHVQIFLQSMGDLWFFFFFTKLKDFVNFWWNIVCFVKEVNDKNRFRTGAQRCYNSDTIIGIHKLHFDVEKGAQYR